MKISIQQSIIPDYRMGLFLLLRKQWGDDFQIYAGDEGFGGSPQSTKEAWRHFQRVENKYFLRGNLLWQKGCFRSLVSADVAILNANMRVVSNTLVLLLRKILRRKTILWGHAEGKNWFASRLRGLYLRLCNGFIAYTQSQAQMIQLLSPERPVWVAANSCVRWEDCMPCALSRENADQFIYVGRLVREKKVGLLLESFLEARARALIPRQARLVFVGDGEERSVLEARVQECDAGGVVEFAGHISDTERLRASYRDAICSVSPGYVGLSATQSFSFGIPMLIASDEFHSPEIEACREGFNARFFASDDVKALAEELGLVYSQKNGLFASGKEIADWTQQNYSFEAMNDAFVRAVEEV